MTIDLQHQRSNNKILPLLPPTGKPQMVWWRKVLQCHNIHKEKNRALWYLLKNVRYSVLGTYALRLLSTWKPVFDVVRVSMLLKWHAEDIYISIYFVTDFQTVWPKVRSLLMKYFLHQDFYQVHSIFQNKGVLCWYFWQNTPFDKQCIKILCRIIKILAKKQFWWQ